MPLISRPSEQYSSNVYPYTSWLTGCPYVLQTQTYPSASREEPIKCVNQFCDYVQIPQRETLDPAPIPKSIYLICLRKRNFFTTT